MRPRGEAGRVRAVMEGWLSRYPEVHRDGLVARLRSNIDEQHRSAFFELFIHELLIVNSFTIMEIEPTLQHTTKKPDYLVQAPDGGRAYVECVIAWGKSPAETAATNRLNQALRAVDTYPCETHFLDLHVRGSPDSPVPINQMKAAMKAWGDQLKPGESAPPFTYSFGGMRLMLTAWPKNTPKAGRAIGVRHFPVETVTTDGNLKAAIEGKAKRYGELDLPYIVAANSDAFFQTESDVLDVLMGTLGVAGVMMKDGMSKMEHYREPNGIWRGPNGPRNQVVSGVLATKGIHPWNFANKTARLVRNPWAARPLPPFPLGVDETNPVDGKWTSTDGKTAGAILGLPEHWPES